MTEQIVPLMQAASMQQAASMPEAPVVTPQPVKEEVPEVVIYDNSFTTLQCGVLVTLGLADPKFDGDSSALKTVSVNGMDYNLHNPFKKGDGVPQGILRAALQPSLKAAARLNDTNLLLVGEESAVKDTIKKALVRVTDHALKSLLIPSGAVMGTLIQDDHTDDLLFSDVVRVTSWVGEAQQDEPNDVGGLAYKAMLHFYVNCAQLYESQNQLKSIKQIESSLILNYRRSGATGPLWIGLNLASENLNKQSSRELLSLLLETEDYLLLTEKYLVEHSEEFDFLPETSDQVRQELFNPKVPLGDMLLVKVLNVPQVVAKTQP